jgi:hypothetical protein
LISHISGTSVVILGFILLVERLMPERRSPDHAADRIHRRVPGILVGIVSPWPSVRRGPRP